MQRNQPTMGLFAIQKLVEALSELIGAEAEKGVAHTAVDWAEGVSEDKLTEWRDSRSSLVPLMLKSRGLEEDIPLAEDLSAVAQAGLEALDYPDSDSPAPKSR